MKLKMIVFNLHRQFMVKSFCGFIILAVLIFLSSYSLINRLWIGLAFWGLLALADILWLYHCRVKLTRMLTLFVSKIEYSDSGICFHTDDASCKVDSELVKELERASNVFLARMHAMDCDRQFREALLDNLDTCMMVMDEDEHLCWGNRRAVEVFNWHDALVLDNLKCFQDDMPMTVRQILPGEHRTVRCKLLGVNVPMILSVSDFSDGSVFYRVLRFDNIPQDDICQCSVMQSRMDSVFSHEIKNLSASTLSMLQTLICDVKRKGDIAVLPSLEIVEQRMQRLLSFIERYRSFSRFPEPELVRTSADVWLSSLRQEFPFVVYDGPAHLNVYIMIDTNQMEHVIVNLINNAQEACSSQKDARIRLSVSVSSDAAKLSVSVWNNGPVISADAQKRLFVPFYTTKPIGTGIGLYLSRLIVQAHHGMLDAISEPEYGTAFVIQLPLA